VSSFKNARNVAIVLALAAAVYLLPGGGRAASTFESVLWVAFGVGLAYMAVRLYREHQITVHGLGEHYRGLLYGAVAVVALAVAGRERMWQTGLGELVWFALIGLVVYALLSVYRHWRSY
jgi:hypothetical protein